MRGKSITRYGIILISAFATLSVHAQQQKPTQEHAAEVLKADVACKALWADHAFDPLRDRFPLGGEKPTFAMLTDGTRLLPKDKPLADLAIKTIEKCRALLASANVGRPEQTKLRLQGFEREQDSLG